MNLSLYLLLTPPLHSKPSVRFNRPPRSTTYRYPAQVLEPVRTGDTKVPARLQASRCRPATETQHSLNAVQLKLAACIVFNAMGFLLMSSGLLLLLQIAQESLS